MMSFSDKHEIYLKAAITLLVPGFLGLITFSFKANGASQTTTTQALLPGKPNAAQAITFADVVESPGSGIWQTTASGIKYLDLIVGRGPSPKIGQRVMFLYAVRLENGQVVAANRMDPKSSHLETLTYVYGYTPLPAGWNEAVSTMSVGSWRRFILPPQLAYGDSTLGGKLPPNSTLIIDAQLLYLDQAIQPKDTF